MTDDLFVLPGNAGDPTAATPSAGSCTLVGAGPGDPDLLTLAAARAIRRATVLLVIASARNEWIRSTAKLVTAEVQAMADDGDDDEEFEEDAAQ